MRRAQVLFTSTLALASAFLICAARGKAASSTGASFNVTITVYDTDATGVTTHIGSDDHNGTGYAVYSSARDPNTTTDVYAGYKLYLNLYSQSARTLFINANDPLPGSPAGPAPGQYWQNVELYAECFDASGASVLLQNITGSSGNCRLGVDFYSAGNKYKLDMGPVLPGGATAAPATGWAYIQCNALSAAGSCVSWTITPNLSGPTPTVANLYYYAKGGKLTYLHQYYDTYRISFTNP
jgi:hypothetical protein